MQLDSSKSVAARLPNYIAYMKNMSGLDTFFQTLDQIQPEDVQNAAKKYLTESGRTVVSLTGAK
jgi:zinc protease